MQFSQQRFCPCPHARPNSAQAVFPSVCSKKTKAQAVTGNKCHDLLLHQRSSKVARCPNLRSWHSADRHARLVGARRIVARTANAPDFVSDENGLWQWRKAQLYKIALFTGPALSIPLADPIMSLVDTVCIGQVPVGAVLVIGDWLIGLRIFCLISVPGLQYTGTLELAALGPTMLIFNLFTYIFTAITITTVRCYSLGTDAAAAFTLYCI